MNTAVCLLLVFLEIFASAQDYRSYHHEVFGSENEQSQQAPADYNYSYDVRDDTTGDRKSQEESRNGNVVRGRYSVLDADGSTRVVEYTVDSKSGFNAVVRRDGEQISLPIPNSRVNLVDQNQYQNRRIQPNPTIIRNHQSGRYVYPNTGTRLAQDARTGNVIDVASGFGAAPYFSSNQNIRSNPSVRILSNQVSTDRVIPSSNELTNHRTQVGQISQEDVQETYARSQYQTAFPIGQHVANSPSHSYTPHFRAIYNTRANSALNQFAPRQSQVDVRTPTAILPNTDSSIMPSNFDSSRQGNEQSYFNYPANNDFTTNELYQQNLENPTEQGSIVSSTPAPQHLIGATPQVSQESNRSDTALFRQEYQGFGARINVYNAPNMQHQDQSFNQGSFTENTPEEPSQSYEGISDARPIIATTENYQDNAVTVEAVGNHQIFEQRHLYPASTTPLEATHNAEHFFTRSLIGPGVTVQADQVNIPNYNTITSQFHQVPVTPIHHTSPISHDVHLIH